MTLEKRRQVITAIWMGCAFATASFSVVFNNAGMISFALAVVGITFLAIGMIQEFVVYQIRKKRGVKR